MNTIEQIIALTKSLTYLELTALENALQTRRYNMRRDEEKKFKDLSDLQK